MGGICGRIDGTRRHQEGRGRRKLASPRGFEPLAYCLGGSRSIQLSYGDACGLPCGDRVEKVALGWGLVQEDILEELEKLLRDVLDPHPEAW